MTPNDTNHDTLQVYFDFLEDNNHDTEELRENLVESSRYWTFCASYNTAGDVVGCMGLNMVGVAYTTFYDYRGRYSDKYCASNIGEVGFNFNNGYFGHAVGTKTEFGRYVGNNRDDT